MRLIMTETEWYNASYWKTAICANVKRTKESTWSKETDKEDVASGKEETLGQAEVDHITTNKSNGKCHAHQVMNISSRLGEMVIAESRIDRSMAASIDCGDGCCADLD